MIAPQKAKTAKGSGAGFTAEYTEPTENHYRRAEERQKTCIYGGAVDSAKIFCWVQRTGKIPLKAMMFDKPNRVLAPIRDGFGGGGGGGGGTVAPAPSSAADERAIGEELATLERWADDNEKDAKRDKFQYWVLKGPAIGCAAATSALEYFKWGGAVIVFGVVSASCIAIDAVHPRGVLYNVHRRAGNEIRLFRDRVKTQWNSVLIAHLDPKNPERIAAAQKILQSTLAEKKRINDYLTAAEAGLGQDKKPEGS